MGLLVMILGLILFFGVHTLTTQRELRAQVVDSMGEGTYKVGYTLASPLVLSIAMIWLAHIGFDRALGYGLKYASGFTFTHLGRIGRNAAN